MIRIIYFFFKFFIINKIPIPVYKNKNDDSVNVRLHLRESYAIWSPGNVENESG